MNQSKSATIKIGWATADVTPPRPINLAGQFHMRIARDVKDPLTITALALSHENSADATIFLSADILMLTERIQQGIRDAVHSRAPDMDVARIIINCTHTHAAPMLDDDIYSPVPAGVMTGTAYANFFIERAAGAVIEAWQAHVPGKLAWGLGHAVVGRNRRVVYFDDQSERPGHHDHPGHCTTRFARMYGATSDPMFSHVEGYEDHSVDLLYTWNGRDELTGMIVNLACPSQASEGIGLVSADFWHETRLAIRSRLGAGIFVLPQCSAAGDQSPHEVWYKGAENRMRELRGLDSRGEIARRIANTVADVLPLAQKERHDNLVLGHSVCGVALPWRMISDTEADQIRKGMAELEACPASSNPDAAKRFAEDTAHATSIARCRITLQRHERQQKEPTLVEEIHVVRIGDVAFATSPFEMFLDYGIRIKARSPAIQTFVMQLATPGPGWDGNYLPTVRAEHGESYSANYYCNSIGAAGGQMLVEEILKMLNELWQA